MHSSIKNLPNRLIRQIFLHSSRRGETHHDRPSNAMGFTHPTCCHIDDLLPRQYRNPHQEFIHSFRALAAFADRPYHQRLAAPYVAGCEYLGG